MKIKTFIKSCELRLKYKKRIDKNIKAGTKLIVVSGSEHGIEIGTKIFFSTLFRTNGNSNNITAQGYCCHLKFSNVRLYEYSISDADSELKEAEEEIKKAEQRVSDIKLKLEFMKEANLTEFNENEFKAYRALKMLDTDLPTLGQTNSKSF